MDGINFSTLMERLRRGEPIGIEAPVIVTHSSLGPRDAEEGRAYPLSRDREITVGRDEGADVMVAGAEISRRHCAFSIRDTRRVTITDLGTRNGTDVNGRPVPRGRPLTIPEQVATVRLGDRATIAVMDPKSLTEYLWMLIRACRIGSRPGVGA